MLLGAIIFKIIQYKQAQALQGQEPEDQNEIDMRMYKRFKKIEKEAIRRQAELELESPDFIFQNQQPVANEKTLNPMEAVRGPGA